MATIVPSVPHRAPRRARWKVKLQFIVVTPSISVHWLLGRIESTFSAGALGRSPLSQSLSAEEPSHLDIRLKKRERIPAAARRLCFTPRPKRLRVRHDAPWSAHANRKGLSCVTTHATIELRYNAPYNDNFVNSAANRRRGRPLPIRGEFHEARTHRVRIVRSSDAANRTTDAHHRLRFPPRSRTLVCLGDSNR